MGWQIRGSLRRIPRLPGAIYVGGVRATPEAPVAANVLLAGDAPELVAHVESVLQRRMSDACIKVASGVEDVSCAIPEVRPDVLILASAQSCDMLRDVVRALRGTPDCEHVPVLLVCEAPVDEAHLLAAAEAGVDDVVSIADGDARLAHSLSLLLRMKHLEDRMAAARARAKALLAEQTALLQRSEQRLRSLLKHAKDGVIVTDDAGRIRFISPSVQGLLGWSEEQAKGGVIWRQVHRDDRQLLRREWDTLVKNPMGGLTTDARVKTIRGEWRWLRFVVTNQLQVPGVMGVVINCSDITGQRRALEALQASRERYQRLLATTNEGIWVTDESDRTTYVSDRMAAMLGFRPEEMLFKRPEEFMFPEDVAAYHERMQAREAGVVESYEHRFRKSDGSTLWARVSAMPIYDQPNTYAGSFGMVQDITRERETAAALREALGRFEALIENTPLVAVQGMDRGGTIMFWNAACARLYGYAAEEAIGAKLQDLILPQEERERFLSTLDRLWETGQPTAVEQWTVHSRAGEERHVMSTMVPVGQPERVSLVYCMDVDITERIQAQRELEQSKAELEAINNRLEALVSERTAALREAIRDLESFAYSVTHDLKAPLRAINGFTGFLLAESQHELSPEAARYLQVIVDNARHMSNLIDRLLTFSRCGRQSMRLRMLDMKEVLRQALALQDAAEKARAEIVIGELPPCYGDDVLLCQVLANLLSNALKYSRKREQPRIEVFFVGERDGLNVYAVRDNGVGYDPRYEHRLFQVFHSLHDRSEYEGSGVGLATVKRILKRHGGDCWAESQLGQGATFYFSVPASPPPTTPSP